MPPRTVRFYCLRFRKSGFMASLHRLSGFRVTIKYVLYVYSCRKCVRVRVDGESLAGVNVVDFGLENTRKFGQNGGLR